MVVQGHVLVGISHPERRLRTDSLNKPCFVSLRLEDERVADVVALCGDQNLIVLREIHGKELETHAGTPHGHINALLVQLDHEVHDVGMIGVEISATTRPENTIQVWN